MDDKQIRDMTIKYNVLEKDVVNFKAKIIILKELYSDRTYDVLKNAKVKNINMVIAQAKGNQYQKNDKKSPVNEMATVDIIMDEILSTLEYCVQKSKFGHTVKDAVYKSDYKALLKYDCQENLRIKFPFFKFFTDGHAEFLNHEDVRISLNKFISDSESTLVERPNMNGRMVNRSMSEWLSVLFTDLYYDDFRKHVNDINPVYDICGKDLRLLLKDAFLLPNQMPKTFKNMDDFYKTLLPEIMSGVGA